MKEKLKNNWQWILCILVVFLGCLLLPFSGDDLEWGMKSLSEFGSMLTNPGLNGRYIGNFIVILVTKNIVIRSLVTSLVLTGIVHFIKEETKAPANYAWLLIMLMPVGLFMQGITWTSGFVNYTISTLLLLYTLKYLRDIFKGDGSTVQVIKTCILMFVSSFFLENITIFLLLLSIILNVVYFIKNKKVNKSLLLVMVTSLVAIVLMFIQPTYHKVASGEDTYRSMAHGVLELLKRPILNYVYFIHVFTAYENVALLAVISVGLYINFMKNKTLSKKRKVALNWAFYYSLAYFVFVGLSLFNPEFVLLKSHQLYLNGFLAGLYVICLVIQVWLLFFKKPAFWRLVLPLLCIVGVVAPLAIVTPIGPRNFFVVYILEVIFALYILDEAKFDYKKFSKLITTGLSVVVFYYVFIYFQITKVNIERDKYIKYMSENTEDSVLVVPLVPFNNFVHYDNFSDKHMTWVYNSNKKIREEVTYIFIPYEDWVERVENEGYTR